MILATFLRGGTVAYGVVLGPHVLDLRLAARAAGQRLPPDLAGFIAAGPAALATAAALCAEAEAGRGAEASFALSAVRLLAPIPHPARNIFCVGRNYTDHVAEGYRSRGTEMKMPEAPQFFTKPPSAVIGPDETFPHAPRSTQRLDYEVELALIIGRRGSNIAPADAPAHIFGYTIGNDLTARDLQRRHEQWFKGKGLDRSCPLGPWIVTADAIADPAAMELSLTVNGEPRQRARVSQMIFDIPAIISQLSAGMALEPGDIILTGTPAGVGNAMDPPRLLAAGDVVACHISGIGDLTTRITAG